MQRMTKILIVASCLVVVALIPLIGMALTAETEEPITGVALERASAAALEYVESDGATVPDTEVGDEESYYEVEVTLSDGSEVDVQLDEDFNVVGEEADGANEDDSDDTDG